jgi:hypothetical protein
MGVRTRGLDIKAGAAKRKADRAARVEAEAVIQRWNDQLSRGRDMLWSPTIHAALLAGTPWLDVFCPGCGTSPAIDLRTIDRHPLASVGTLVLGLRCSWCPGTAPMPTLKAKPGGTALQDRSILADARFQTPATPLARKQVAAQSAEPPYTEGGGGREAHPIPIARAKKQRAKHIQATDGPRFRLYMDPSAEASSSLTVVPSSG